MMMIAYGWLSVKFDIRWIPESTAHGRNEILSRFSCGMEMEQTPKNRPIKISEICRG